MASFRMDLRHAMRRLWRSPAFFAAAVGTLGLGIGATTAIFSLIYQVILRPLPVEQPQQIFKLGRDNNCCVYSALQGDWTLFSDEYYRRFADKVRGVAEVGAAGAGSLTVTALQDHDSAQSLPLDVRFVSGNYFSLLGVRAYTGRLFTEQDDERGSPPAAVLSYPLWKSRFRADPTLVGTTVILAGHPVKILGIASPSFIGERITTDPPGIWLPLVMEPLFEPDRKLLEHATESWLTILLRIPNPDSVRTIDALAKSELHTWLSDSRDHYPSATELEIRNQNVEIASARTGISDLRDSYGNSLRLLIWIVAAILLIACANIANLLLVRGIGRSTEFALRTALGASRKSLIGQTLVEALILSLLGGALGLGLASVGIYAIVSVALRGVQINPISSAPSLPVLLFATAISLVTSIIFGVVPAWISSFRTSQPSKLRGSGRSVGKATSLAQKSMVIFQMALSVGLLCVAGLLIQSLRQLTHQNYGFRPDQRLVLDIDLQAAGYKYRDLPGLYSALEERMAHLPGVESFAYATFAPLSDTNLETGVFFADSLVGNSSRSSFDRVSSGYFSTLGSRVLLGRGIDSRDTASSEHVAVVNQSFVRQYFSGKWPIGQQFGSTASRPNEFTIVGVVEDAKYNDPSQPVGPMYFTPISQDRIESDSLKRANEEVTHFAGNLLFKYRGNEGEIKGSVNAALQALNSRIPIIHTQTYSDRLVGQFAEEQLVVRLTTFFGCLALLLASIGLYGLTTYMVTARAQEIGVRMALGSSRSRVLKLFLGQALLQSLIGLGFGLLLAFAAGHLIQHNLYQTPPFNASIAVEVCILLMIAALTAAVIPSTRAAMTSPMKVLRAE